MQLDLVYVKEGSEDNLSYGEEYFKLERSTSYLKYSSLEWLRRVIQITIWTCKFGIKKKVPAELEDGNMFKMDGTMFKRFLNTKSCMHKALCPMIYA